MFELRSGLSSPTDDLAEEHQGENMEYDGISCTKYTKYTKLKIPYTKIFTFEVNWNSNILKFRITFNKIK